MADDLDLAVETLELPHRKKVVRKARVIHAEIVGAHTTPLGYKTNRPKRDTLLVAGVCKEGLRPFQLCCENGYRGACKETDKQAELKPRQQTDWIHQGAPVSMAPGTPGLDISLNPLILRLKHR